MITFDSEAQANLLSEEVVNRLNKITKDAQLPEFSDVDSEKIKKLLIRFYNSGWGDGNNHAIEMVVQSLAGKGDKKE